MSNTTNITQNIKLLSSRIEAEVQRISNDSQTEKNQTDSLVYIGNWQDAIPRSIWTDPSLSDIDVRSWGIIRTQAIQGSAVMLSLNTLLKDTRGYSNATVSRILYVLRLTRWISLCSTLRTQSGTFRGNIYAIHDTPVSLDDAMYLDADYLSFVKKQTAHSNKTIRTLAQSIWTVVSRSMETETLFIEGEPVSEKTRELNELVNPRETKTGVKMNNTIHVYNLNVDENIHVQKLNVDAKHHVQILNVDSEKKESDKKQQDDNQVYFLNVVRSSSSSSSSIFKNKDKETTTTNSEGISKKDFFKIEKDLIYPKDFNANEIILSKKFLKLVETETQQDYLDELASKIKKKKNTSNPVDNNIAMLAWLCKEHAKGNICLTSAYLNHRAQREKKQKREEKLKQQQAAITAAALQGRDIVTAATCATDTKEKKPQEKSLTPPPKRWDGINVKIRRKEE